MTKRECEIPEECDVAKQLEDIKRDVGKILESLNGNGVPGIKTRLALLEDGMKVIRTVAIAVVLAVVGLVVKAIWGLT